MAVPLHLLVQRAAQLRTLQTSGTIHQSVRMQLPVAEPATLQFHSPEALINSIVAVACQAAEANIRDSKLSKSDVVSKMELLFDALAYYSIAAEFDETIVKRMEEPIILLKAMGKELKLHFESKLGAISILDWEAMRAAAKTEVVLLNKLLCLFPTDPWFMFYIAAMNVQIALAEKATGANPIYIFATAKEQLDSSEKSLSYSDESQWCISLTREEAAGLFTLIAKLNRDIQLHIVPYVRQPLESTK